MLVFLCNDTYAWTSTSYFRVRRASSRKQDYPLRRVATTRFAFWDEPDDVNNEDTVVAPLPSISPVAVVRRSLPLYVGFFSLGVLPAIDFVSQFGASAVMTLDVARLIYFSILALTIVYLGAERQDIGTTQVPVTGKGAALAPVFAAATLAILYAIIKYTTLDPGALYRVFTCIFGWICLTEVIQSFLALGVTGENIALEMKKITDQETKRKEQELSKPLVSPMATAKTVGESERDAAKFRYSGVPAAVIALIPISIYLLCVSSLNQVVDVQQLRYVATSNNFIASAIALASLGQIAIESFTAGASLLVGLFLYDAASVFGSNAMLTVATKIEAPVKIIFSGAIIPSDGRYPFSVLGLGDILAPGVFISLLRQFDLERWYDHDRKEQELDSSPLEKSLDLYVDAETPYFITSMVAYAAGLGLTFVAVALTGKGQPALFYIVPALLVASFGTAVYRGELETLLAFKGSRAVAAKKARDDWKEARKERRRNEEAKK